jgi:hypothetical protein
MPSNHVLLRQIALTADTASITISNIPQTGYTDLLIKMKTKVTLNNGGRSYWGMRFNGDSSAIYGSRWTAGYDGSGTLALGNTTNSTATGIIVSSDGDSGANAFGSVELYIPSYAGTTYNKILHNEGVTGNTAGTQQMNAIVTGIWNSTAAINSITVFPNDGGDLVTGSMISIYGVANQNTTPLVSPKATGGDIVTTDGTYWYHAFLASGIFTPASGLSCDSLVIAGGGAGGAWYGGGGGAGGYIYSTSDSISSASVVTVGSGGAGATLVVGSNGSNSLFNSRSAIGGGYGGSTTTAPNSGGSGGGGVYGSNSGGAATSGQGNVGGNAVPDTSSNGNAGAGGGGAGAVGQSRSTNTNTDIGGNGGNGLSTWSSWGAATGTGQNISGTYWYAGGGAGGNGGYNAGGGSFATGGNGGGGAGQVRSTSAGNPGLSGKSATANTGGGGGAGSGGSSANSPVGGNGGSGIVIIRYAV